MQLVEHQGPGRQNRLLPHPVAVQAELQKVGEQQIREGRSVALQLLGVFDIVQPFFSRPLGLDVADDAIGAVPQPEIRIAALGRFGQSGDVHVLSAAVIGDLFEHRRQGRVEALLSRVALPRNRGKVLEIAGKDGFLVHKFILTGTVPYP